MYSLESFPQAALYCKMESGSELRLGSFDCLFGFHHEVDRCDEGPWDGEGGMIGYFRDGKDAKCFDKRRWAKEQVERLQL